MGDCVFGALAMMLPDRVFAASDGGNTGVSLGGYDAERKPFIFVDFACCSWGGRPYADGVQGNAKSQDPDISFVAYLDWFGLQ